jgi:subtilisin family serine protease
MHRRSCAVALAALSLAACSTDMVAPDAAKAVKSPLSSVVDGAAGRYIVVMKGNGIAKGFAEQVKALGGAVASSHQGAGIAVVSGLSDAAASQLAGFGDVEKDFAVSVSDVASQARPDAANLAQPFASHPTDPTKASRFAFQWDMRLINAPTAWTAKKFGNSGVTVAILDTGIDYGDADLNGRVDLSRSVSFMNHFVGNSDDPTTPEDESSPIVPSDDAIIKAFFPDQNLITDLNGHGTNVSTQVASNAAAIAGVTSQTTLIGVKVLGTNGVGDFSDILNGVLWAADHGADVANMSLGGGFSKAGNGQALSTINRVFNYAKQKGMLIVVAAGNSSADLQHNGNDYATFCDASHVICVSSVGPIASDGSGDVPAFYTNYGRSQVNVAAPGGNGVLNPDGSLKGTDGWPWGTSQASWVWSICPARSIIIQRDADKVHGDLFLTLCSQLSLLNGYIGTSQASPHVAGLAALLVDKYGHGQPQTIKQAILKSAAPVNPLLGRGRIDVKNALGL